MKKLVGRVQMVVKDLWQHNVTASAMLHTFSLVGAQHRAVTANQQATQDLNFATSQSCPVLRCGGIGGNG
ncbi:MAG: hypothetical protein WC974_08900 [Thermoplasmata archaeon]